MILLQVMILLEAGSSGLSKEQDGKEIFRDWRDVVSKCKEMGAIRKMDSPDRGGGPESTN